MPSRVLHWVCSPFFYTASFPLHFVIYLGSFSFNFIHLFHWLHCHFVLLGIFSLRKHRQYCKSSKRDACCSVRILRRNSGNVGISRSELYVLSFKNISIKAFHVTYRRHVSSSFVFCSYSRHRQSSTVSCTGCWLWHREIWLCEAYTSKEWKSRKRKDSLLSTFILLFSFEM